MNLNDTVGLRISVGTLSTLIAGLYVIYSSIDINAVPSSLFIELAEKLVEYLPEWQYDVMSFEDWIKYELLIMPIDFFTEDELKDMENSTIFIKRKLGNVTLVVNGNISWEE